MELPLKVVKVCALMSALRQENRSVSHDRHFVEHSGYPSILFCCGAPVWRMNYRNLYRPKNGIYDSPEADGDFMDFCFVLFLN